MPTDNQDIQAGRHFHDGTKHPHGFLMNPWHPFDPARQPLLFKKYLQVESIPLSEDQVSVGVPALQALQALPGEGERPTPLDLQSLSRLLFFSAGITKHLRFPWGRMPFRAAACTGALYHIELYVVCGDLDGLPAGVYHFDPQANALDVLRRGDYRPYLASASAGEPAVERAQAVIVYSDVFWRNACKYQARAYRHAFWDSGTILSHTLAMALAAGLHARVVLGFVDQAVDHLLGLDGRREVTLALLPVGRDEPAPAGIHPAVVELAQETQPISRLEPEIPAIVDMHRASSLPDEAQVQAWRMGAFPEGTETEGGPGIPLKPIADGDLPSDPLEEVIIRRGSSRQFAPQPISFRQLSTILAKSTGGFPVDYPLPQGGALNQLYLIVHSVEGLTPGAYVFHREQAELELLQEGEFRREAGALGLGQALPRDACVNVYFLADLPGAFQVLGNRGYRAAQLEASIAAGRIYLAAYALGLGATGLTFFDDQVVAFFSPHARDRDVMFLIAVGVPTRRTY